MIALAIGTLLAVGALAFVLAPLFQDVGPASETADEARHRSPDALRGEQAVDALREIEFDRTTGKLSDADYEALKATYTREALAAMRAEDATPPATPAPAPVAPAEDPAEAIVRAIRESRRGCSSCGPRPEPDARYCSECGSYLSGICAHCGSEVSESGARYCANCGGRLAA